MPTSVPRKTASRRPAKQPANALQAEAKPDQFVIPFTWEGTQFEVNVRDISYGRVAYAARIAGNEHLDIYQRVNAMLDALEGMLGQEQVAKAVEAQPRLLDDAELMNGFLTALNQAIVGGTPGESQAS